MLSYSLETSHEVIDFLTKSGLISIFQRNDLKKLSKEHKMNELGVLLKFFPENEDKIPAILKKIHKLNEEGYYPKEKDKLFKLGEFIFVKREGVEPFFLTHDPQSIIDYFNYLVPGTIILTPFELEELDLDLPAADPGDVNELNSEVGNISIQSMTEVTQQTEIEEEISENAVKQLDKLIRDAIRSNASDVHIEIDSDKNGILFYRVRNRVDGRLKEVFSSNNLEVFSGILTQVKLKAGLKLDETRMPQDGRMNYSIFGETHSFRVSTKPVISIDMKKGGEVQMEKIVIRKMPDVNNLGLEQLDNTEYAVGQLREASELANGFNIITGPTGSGKTTLLYAILGDIDRETKNVSTIEDPVEAELKNVNQTQTLAEIGLDFARVLRAELRQDPDIIMVGEMRDKETAEIAAEASLTGHLVFSTLHTKDAVASITRLINIGVPSFIVATSLTYCVAQRLVRKLCPHCRQPVKDVKDFKSRNIDPVFKKIATAEAKEFFKKMVGKMEIYEAKKDGCNKCGGVGYMGRTAILEVFKINEAAEEVIVKQNANEALLHEIAIKNGMMTMEQDGMIKVMRGMTSINELYTVLVAN